MTDVRVAHAIPGRFRLHISALRGNPTLGREIAEHMWTQPGVQWVETHASTGSLVVVYDVRADRWQEQMEDLAASLAPLLPEVETRAVAGWFDASPGLFADGSTERVSAFFRNVNERVGSATGGADLALLFPLTLVSLGLGRFLFAEKLHVPQWYDLLWFGLGTYMMFNAAAAATGRVAAGPDAESSAP